jgi:hypothetical protein
MDNNIEKLIKEFGDEKTKAIYEDGVSKLLDAFQSKVTVTGRNNYLSGINAGFEGVREYLQSELSAADKREKDDFIKGYQAALRNTLTRVGQAEKSLIKIKKNL